MYCDVLYRDLSKGLESLMLNSFLHLLYLVTPYDMISQCKPDWMTYFRQVGSHSLSSTLWFTSLCMGGCQLETKKKKAIGLFFSETYPVYDAVCCGAKDVDSSWSAGKLCCQKGCRTDYKEGKAVGNNILCYGDSFLLLL